MAVTAKGSKAKTAPAENKFAKKLASMKKVWATAKAKVGLVECSVDDGTYRGTLTGCSVGEDSGGNLTVDWVVTVLEGDFEGEEVKWSSNTKTEENIGWLKRDLGKFGYEIDDPTDLPEVCATILGEEPEVRFSVKTNDAGFTNIFVNKVVAGDGIAAEAPADDAEEAAEEVAEAEVEEVAEEAELEVGSEVTTTIAKKEVQCTVMKIAEDGVTVKAPDGKKFKVAADKLTLVPAETEEAEAAEEVVEEDQGELEKGSRVETVIAKKKETGTVVSVDEADETCKVKLDSNKKLYVVKVANIVLID